MHSFVRPPKCCFLITFTGEPMEIISVLGDDIGLSDAEEAAVEALCAARGAAACTLRRVSLGPSATTTNPLPLCVQPGAKVYFLNGTSTFNGECLTPACFCYRSRGHAAGEPLHRIVAALPGCAAVDKQLFIERSASAVPRSGSPTPESNSLLGCNIDIGARARRRSFLAHMPGAPVGKRVQQRKHCCGRSCHRQD